MKPVVEGCVTPRVRESLSLCRNDMDDEYLAFCDSLLDLLDFDLAESLDFEQCFASCPVNRLESV